jgi:hypothetical protein
MEASRLISQSVIWGGAVGFQSPWDGRRGSCHTLLNELIRDSQLDFCSDALWLLVAGQKPDSLPEQKPTSKMNQTMLSFSDLLQAWSLGPTLCRLPMRSAPASSLAAPAAYFVSALDSLRLYAILSRVSTENAQADGNQDHRKMRQNGGLGRNATESGAQPILRRPQDGTQNYSIL